MKRTLLVLGMVLALAMTAMANVEPTSVDAEITSPTAGEVIYENTLYLEARNTETKAPLLDATAPDRTAPWIAWAVRSPVVGTCDGDGNNWAGDTNTDVFAGTKALDAATGTFTAEIDITTWPAGEYCFVFVPTDQVQSRQYLSFYIVDEYAKVGGNVDNAGYLMSDYFNIDLKKLKGKQLSHAFEGVVGNAGSEGAVGSITVNYRQLDTQCTFTPGELALSNNDSGIALNGLRANLTGFDGLCTDDSTTSSANIFLLDKDADSNRDAPRGAVVLRWNGNPSMSEYEIDGTPDATGADSWVPLVNGNVEVGIR